MIIFAPVPCLPPDENACASKNKALYVSLTHLSWLQIMCLNRELLEKHGSICAQPCLDVGKRMAYFIHAEKLLCCFLLLLCFFRCSLQCEWHTRVDCEGSILSVQPSANYS